MKITSIDIDGFKGRQIRVDLSGRDIIRADNFSGKTATKEAIDFWVTGSIQGCKREDLIDYAPGGRFSVALTTDSGMTITRTFRVKGSKTTMDLEFDPAGLEENLTECEAKLAKLFHGSPLVAFDLTRFLVEDDAYRLKTCMEHMPKQSADDVDEKFRDAVEGVGDKLRADADSDSLKAQIAAVELGILDVQDELPDSMLERCNVLAGLVKDKWAKKTRADVTAKTKAVREIGSLSRQDGVSGVNLESLQEQLKEAQESLDVLQRDAGAAGERRRLVLDLTAKIDQERVKLEAQEKDEARHTVTLKDCEKGVDSDKKKFASWEKSETIRIAGVEEELARSLVALEDFNKDIAIEQEHRAVAVKGIEASENQNEMLGERIQENENFVHSLESSTGSCPMCESALGSERVSSLKEKLLGDIAEYKGTKGINDAKVACLKEECDAANNLILDLEDDITHIDGTRNRLESQLPRCPNPVTEPGALDLEISNAKDRLATIRNNVDFTKTRINDWLTERGDLAAEIPEELQEDVITGAEMERNRIADQIEEVKRSRQRFEDQEKLRMELDNSERRLKALKLWGDALGLKGLAGTIMASEFQPIIEPAQRLVHAALPDTTLEIGWITPRGKPGMRLFLRRGDARIAYVAMCGAERAIVGTAVVVAFAGIQNAPTLICLEAEVMSDKTEEAYLRALDDMMGETSVMVMTHHGKDDLGVYRITDL